MMSTNNVPREPTRIIGYPGFMDRPTMTFKCEQPQLHRPCEKCGLFIPHLSETLVRVIGGKVWHYPECPTEATMNKPQYKDCERCGFPNELDAESSKTGKV